MYQIPIFAKIDVMTCYICGAESTSVEHAPAKSFFPRGQRNNLITVPSCSVHNEETSKDDEYVRNIIAMMIGNNGHALTHFLKTCLASFTRSPKLLTRTTAVNKRVYVADNASVTPEPTISIQIERDRIELVLRKIGYALFFHQFGKPWGRTLNVATEYLVTQNFQQDELGEIIKEIKSAPEYIEPILDGNNPEIFKYSFLPTESENVFDQVLVMKFYEGFEVWLLPVTGTTSPNLLTQILKIE